MRGTLSLGRWAGIPVSANLSVLVIVLLVAAGLGFGTFPIIHPDRPGWMYLLAGVTAGLLLLVSILVHELAHALVARGNGIEVEGITLWLLGGVSQLRGAPRTPRVDLLVAVVGPLASVAVAIAFGLLSVASAATIGPGLITTMLAYLAVINLILAGFNLLPAAPLDGGRVLRAALWWWSEKQNWAAVTAARVGRYFGVALIVLGIAATLMLGWFSGLWMALIGWFLVTAAQAEERGALLGGQLKGVLVQEVMSQPAVTAAPSTTVATFIDEVVLRQRFSTYPLVDDSGRLTGLTTLNRIRQVSPEQRESTRLADIACPVGEVPTTHPEEPLVDLLPRMSGCADGRAVVLDSEERVLAVVSPSDVSRAAARAELAPPESRV
jgi:Zn-dependent protease